MPAPAPISAQRIAAVRRFNRFYTQRLGVLQRGWLDSPYSLTEARVLYEIKQRGRTTASDIARELDLDAGYLSRILRRFQRHGLIRRQASPEDGRQSFLSITARGRRAFAPLERRTEQQVGTLLERLSAPEQEHLVAAMRAIESMMDAHPNADSEIVLRAPQAGDLGWVVTRHAELYAVEYGWGEEFEGLCAQIGRSGCARARAGQAAYRRMHPVCPRAPLSKHHAVDASGADRSPSRLRAGRLSADLERSTAQLRLRCRERALGPDAVAGIRDQRRSGKVTAPSSP